MKAMSSTHVPSTNARYWAGILLASVFGTNTGDWFAFRSGLGILGGLPFLAILVALVFWYERRDQRQHDAWYWLVIIMIRTGATNIADFVCGGRFLGMNRILFSLLLAAFMAVMVATGRRKDPGQELPATDGRYWITMLAAGVFGTSAGDSVLGAFGGPDGNGGIYASLVLVAILAGLLLAGRGGRLLLAPFYWLTIAVARTAGTAIADMLAENERWAIGLVTSTIITGLAFSAVLLFMQGGARRQPEAA